MTAHPYETSEEDSSESLEKYMLGSENEKIEKEFSRLEEILKPHKIATNEEAEKYKLGEDDYPMYYKKDLGEKGYNEVVIVTSANSDVVFRQLYSGKHKPVVGKTEYKMPISEFDETYSPLTVIDSSKLATLPKMKKKKKVQKNDR